QGQVAELVGDSEALARLRMRLVDDDHSATSLAIEASRDILGEIMLPNFSVECLRDRGQVNCRLPLACKQASGAPADRRIIDARAHKFCSDSASTDSTGWP